MKRFQFLILSLVLFASSLAATDHAIPGCALAAPKASWRVRFTKTLTEFKRTAAFITASTLAALLGLIFTVKTGRKIQALYNDRDQLSGRFLHPAEPEDFFDGSGLCSDQVNLFAIPNAMGFRLSKRVAVEAPYFHEERISIPKDEWLDSRTDGYRAVGFSAINRSRIVLNGEVRVRPPLNQGWKGWATAPATAILSWANKFAASRRSTERSTETQRRIGGMAVALWRWQNPPANDPGCMVVDPDPFHLMSRPPHMTFAADPAASAP